MVGNVISLNQSFYLANSPKLKDIQFGTCIKKLNRLLLELLPVCIFVCLRISALTKAIWVKGVKRMHKQINGAVAVCLNLKHACMISSSGLVQIPVSMYQTVVTSLAQGNRPVQVAMAPVATRIDNTVTLDGQAVEVVTLEQ